MLGPSGREEGASRWRRIHGITEGLCNMRLMRATRHALHQEMVAGSLSNACNAVDSGRRDKRFSGLHSAISRPPPRSAVWQPSTRRLGPGLTDSVTLRSKIGPAPLESPRAPGVQHDQAARWRQTRLEPQPWDSLLFAALAAVIVAFNRKHCFDKNAGAVERLVSTSAPHASPVKLA